MRQHLALTLLASAIVCSRVNGSTSWSKVYKQADAYLANIALRPDRSHNVSILFPTGPCVARIDAAGNAAPATCFDRGRSGRVAPASDGGYFVFGSRPLEVPNEPTHNAGWAIKVDPAGKVSWSRRFVADEDVRIAAGDATPDGGLVFVGAYGETPNNWVYRGRAALVVKLSRSGAIEWQRAFDVAGNDTFEFVKTVADGYVVSGIGQQFGGRLAKLDRSGALQWQQWFRNSYVVNSVVENAGGGFLAVGAWAAENQLAGYWLARVTPNGRVLWEQASEHVDRGDLIDLARVEEGKFVAFGDRMIGEQSAVQILAVTPNGDVVWQRDIALALGVTAGSMSAAPEGFVIATRGPATVEFHKFDANGRGSACIEPAAAPSNIRFQRLQFVPLSPPLEQPQTTLSAVDDRVQPAQQALAIDPSCRPATRLASGDAAEPKSEEQEKILAAVRQLEQQVFDEQKRASTLLNARKFEDLDRLGKELRESRAETGGGYPKLANFYNVLSTTSGTFGVEQKHLALIEEWMRKSPRSPAAAVAAATTYLNYAWVARGSGSRDTVTGEAWQKFERLMQRVGAILQSSAAYAASDPQYQVLRVQLAGASCEKKLKEIVYDKAAGAMNYPPFFRTAGVFLLLRWCGSPEEYRAYAEYAAATAHSDALYALLAWDAVATEGDMAVLVVYKFDWPRIKRGFLELGARYPMYPLSYHRLARLTYIMRDRVTAQDLFGRPYLLWIDSFSDVWKTREQYDRIRQWALQTRTR